MLAVVDTSPLYAAADDDDDEHDVSLRVFQRPDLHFVIPALVVAETTYLIALRLGPQAEARFLRSLERFEVEAPIAEEWPRVAELVEKYSDFPLGGTDASVIALAERLGTEVVVTLDRRHFAAVKPRHCEAFQLLPE